ncbi:MAG: hypothetical protein COB20_08105 [SAR86 cluster bacterium]|uniref:Uncharacterized protein n=1 Tax=SAR86 cluster bacterium TaxID=2030880 RepID=A0A2A4X585_9GAMM|nr:MAG: hypothetical protein COB20_08105 [SAR86 cluster bacterium]
MRIDRFHKIVILIFCLALAGPELGIGLELIVLVDAFGIELLLISLTASLWSYWYFVKAKLEEFDSYFFTSPLRDILKCPALLAHAIPGSMGLFMFVLGLTVISI